MFVKVNGGVKSPETVANRNLVAVTERRLWNKDTIVNDYNSNTNNITK